MAAAAAAVVLGEKPAHRSAARLQVPRLAEAEEGVGAAAAAAGVLGVAGVEEGVGAGAVALVTVQLLAPSTSSPRQFASAQEEGVGAVAVALVAVQLLTLSSPRAVCSPCSATARPPRKLIKDSTKSERFNRPHLDPTFTPFRT